MTVHCAKFEVFIQKHQKTSCIYTFLESLPCLALCVVGNVFCNTGDNKLAAIYSLFI